MGQTNQCCHMPFGPGQFDVNQVRIYWPQAAEQILRLRQANKQIKLKAINTSHQHDSRLRVYKEFISSKYCFFGYVNYFHQNTTLENLENPIVKQSQIKLKNLTKRKSAEGKQNVFTLSLLPAKIQLNDFGILIEKQRSCYAGYFSKNKFHGKGFLSVLEIEQQFEGIFQNGNKLNGTYQNKQLKYTGDFRRGQIQGKGKIEWKHSKNVYEGSVLNEKMHGKGKMVYENGDFYDGEFQNGYYEGKGRYFWASGQIFQGMYKKGKKHGFGVIQIGGKQHQLCWVNDRAQAKPLNYKQFQSKKQIMSRKQLRKSKTKHSIKHRKQQFLDRVEKDDATSIINHQAKTSIVIV